MAAPYIYSSSTATAPHHRETELVLTFQDGIRKIRVPLYRTISKKAMMNALVGLSSFQFLEVSGKRQHNAPRLTLREHPHASYRVYARSGCGVQSDKRSSSGDRWLQFLARLPTPLRFYDFAVFIEPFKNSWVSKGIPRLSI